MTGLLARCESVGAGGTRRPSHEWVVEMDRWFTASSEPQVYGTERATVGYGG